MSESKTPGQAAYEAWAARMGEQTKWSNLTPSAREAFDAAAEAARKAKLDLF